MSPLRDNDRRPSLVYTGRMMQVTGIVMFLFTPAVVESVDFLMGSSAVLGNAIVSIRSATSGIPWTSVLQIPWAALSVVMLILGGRVERAGMSEFELLLLDVFSLPPRARRKVAAHYEEKARKRDSEFKVEADV